ncbi:MAG: hypothetical protein LBK73_12425 [Treponema sp.]|nr:hypothetical protein [Treponema sp.]
MSLTFPRDINYAKDDSGITTLIGTTSEGFDALYASNRGTGLYGVLELQDWANATPSAKQSLSRFTDLGKWTAAEFNQLLSSVIKPYANQNPAFIFTGNPIIAAVFDDRRVMQDEERAV